MLSAWLGCFYRTSCHDGEDVEEAQRFGLKVRASDLDHPITFAGERPAIVQDQLPICGELGVGQYSHGQRLLYFALSRNHTEGSILQFSLTPSTSPYICRPWRTA
jgi:hypothetical protein